MNNDKAKELWDNPSDDYDQRYREIRERLEKNKHDLSVLFDIFTFSIIDRVITYPYSPLVMAFIDIINEQVTKHEAVYEKAKRIFDDEGNCRHIYQCKEMKQGKPTGKILCTTCAIELKDGV